jgi:hypothetical protein
VWCQQSHPLFVLLLKPFGRGPRENIKHLTSSDTS